jgi:hypothetical protein
MLILAERYRGKVERLHPRSVPRAATAGQANARSGAVPRTLGPRGSAFLACVLETGRPAYRA